MPAIAKIDLTLKPRSKKIVFRKDDGDGDSKGVSKNPGKPLETTNGTKQKRKPNATVENNKSPTKAVAKPKKIKFNDDGEIETVSTDLVSETPGHHDHDQKEDEDEEEDEDEDDFFTKREKEHMNNQYQKQSGNDSAEKWYHVYSQFPSSNDVLEMKDNEQMELYNLCKSSFDSEKSIFNKRNPSDYRWLQTALNKGTARDRANAGALLMASNPLGNLEALSTLIGFTKVSNKSSTEVINIITDLWKEVLLPPHRKLLSLQLRGTDWKMVRQDKNLTKDQQKRIYAYWYFENELKDQYFEFLKNLQQAIQTGQENNKNYSIVAAAQLLSFAPEKEQLLLTMLVNKLGDPMPKVASKALHHLTDVANRHPNMCSVIVAEAEKLLFRNNISDRAQHFALCFLSSIAPAGQPEVCTKLVNICFALFKVLVQKGAVNSRIMQAILRCLQKAILDAGPAKGSTEILSKEMQDTVYRLVHLADIRISIQTLGLLLQLITIKTEKNDRFYNALYVKLLDMELTSMGTKTAAQLLHIVHRAIHIDNNLPRIQAFVKRLLQLALYCPPHIAAGCLIVLNKLLRSRKEITQIVADDGIDSLDNNSKDILPKVSPDDEELAKFDSDGEEKYEDIKENDENENQVSNEENEIPTIEDKKPAVASSWHHAKVNDLGIGCKPGKVQEISATKYDPYHRVPAFAGADHALKDELLLLKEHFHPTVQVFANSIINQKRISYYGDPLRDFGLPHFLERFAFKNPKKLDNNNPEAEVKLYKRYTPYGTRGKSVKMLTKENCTEDEMYIFNFLEQKRQRSIVEKKKKSNNHIDDLIDEEEGDQKPVEDVDDDEFEDYLESFFGKKSKKKDSDKVQGMDNDDDDDDELDFLKELGGDLRDEKKKRNKSKKAKGKEDASDEDMDDVDADWGDDNHDEDITFKANQSDLSDDEEGSIDFNKNEEDDDLSDASISMDDQDSDDSDAPSDLDDIDADDNDDDDLPKSQSIKSVKNKSLGLDGKSFAKKLKHSTDMSSLFAAADDFAELLEETGKAKGQGTSNIIFNKDKSSDKQMKWEEKRHSTAKAYTSKKNSGTFKGGKKPFKFSGNKAAGAKKFKSKQKKHL